MLHTIIEGIIIGLFISVPVGPLGILVIQRTISRGRKHGFVTGLGATSSDLVYAVLVAFSMNYIINFIEAHQMWIQILGSIIIFAFGLFLFMSNPVTQLATSKGKTSTGDLISDYFTAFGLCFSNPLIVFLFIGLFARFHYFNPEQKFYEDVTGLVSILLGALAWWTTLTFLVGKLRSQFNVRGLWILNKITGGLLLLLGIGGILMAILGISF